MSERDDVPEVGSRVLDLAVAQLRERPPALPVEVADRMLERALSAPRPAQLVQAGGDQDYLRVSTVALVALLRQRLDASLPHAAVDRVRCEAGRDERLEAVTIDLVVEFGHDVRRVAESARGLLGTTLSEVLGPDAADAAGVRQHVHVSDVTTGDPHLMDPSDDPV